MSAFEALKERGFVKQVTGAEEKLDELLGGDPIWFYAGYDPTADSLHCGHLLPIMIMAHLQRLGHKPIAVIGGGTAMVGDPSGKTEMRKMLSQEDIEANAKGIESQLKRYLSLDGEEGMAVNNADWLLGLGYVEFLREVGRYFRVNEMIKAESYAARLEREEGLSFIEFNYQLLQAYDFLKLHQEHRCLLQVGGDDQWSNILAGLDLVRRIEGGEVQGLTIPLLTTAAGTKMGKTAQGAIWLDAKRTSPNEFFQYWRNVDDRDVERFLALFTFLPMDEVRMLGSGEGAALNEAKQRLAWEATKLCHGEEEAEKAVKAQTQVKGTLAESSIDPERLTEGIPVLDLFAELKLSPSKSEARRLVQGGGARINGKVVEDLKTLVGDDHLEKGSILLQAGKKRFHKLVVR
ncbi:MAG: tyrosine--tRNA ligase [Verrucomicrobiota bacterium]